MTHIFEIKVECKGVAAGTLNWLNSVLENGELVISNTKSGDPGMFLKSKTNSETQKSIFICKVMTRDNENQIQYQTEEIDNGNILAYVYPQADNFGNISGFTDYALTPAALAKCNEFINNATCKFKKWWENQ